MRKVTLLVVLIISEAIGKTRMCRCADMTIHLQVRTSALYPYNPSPITGAIFLVADLAPSLKKEVLPFTLITAVPLKNHLTKTQCK